MTAKDAFAGGTAVITGAGSGIGEGLARRAAALGMRVVAADIAVDRIERVVGMIREAGAEAIAVPTDVTDPSALDRLAARAREAFGPVRLLVNNAGIETLGYSWEISAERWEQTLGVNINGVIHGVRAFAPAMLAAGEPAYIANVASVGALAIMPVQGAYVLSKHAVLSFTEGLFLEMKLQEKPIHVSAILPGPVATRIFDDANGAGAPGDLGRHREVMRNMIAEGGITGLEAADLILEGIAAKQFWVSTHPGMMQAMAKARARHLAELTDPPMTDETRQLLGR